MRSVFQYTPFQSRKNIRLLKFTKEGSNPLERNFSLVEASLDNPEDIPPYTALSYTWGDVSNKSTIQIDNHPFEISANLAEALNYVIPSTSGTSQYLWVDQICINQNDIAEKSGQIRFMGYIYEKAAAVCIWLGNAREDSEIAFDTMQSWKPWFANVEEPVDKPLLLSIFQQMNPGNEKLTELFGLGTSEEQWVAIRQLSRRAWWGRAWVVQEATGPAPTYCLCGNSTFIFQDIIKSLILGRAVTRMPDYPFEPLNTRWAFCMLMMSGLRKHRQLQLLDALQFLRSFSCTDPRDKLYAVLGLVESNQDIIVPDYTRSLSQAYTDVVRYCISAYPPLHQLDFLAYVSGSPEVAGDESWPSFVPNWMESPSFDNFKKTTEEYQITNRLYHASLDIEGSISIEEGRLLVDAFPIDEVAQVKKVCESEEDVKTVLELWKPDDWTAVYRNHRTVGEAYLHTLVGDVYRTPDFKLVRGAAFNMDLLGRGSSESISLSELEKLHHMRVSMERNIVRRRFFRTTTGLMGIGPASMQVGDQIKGFLGGQMLYVVRQKTSHDNQTEVNTEYRFIGECYIDDLMDGQGLQSNSEITVGTSRIAIQ